MSRIVSLFTLFFPPDLGGGATRSMNIARCLVEEGYEVRVITSIPHYPLGQSLSKSMHIGHENVGGIRVVRLPVLGLPHRGKLNRVVIYAWFAIVSLLGIKYCRGSAKIMSLGPHPFTDLSSYIVKVATRSCLIADIADLHPESYPLRNSVANALLQGTGYWINRIILRHLVDRISILNEPALNYIVNRYGYSKPSYVLYNSVDTKGFTYNEKSKAQKMTLKSLIGDAVDGKLVVLYHGFIGPVQALETVVEAAIIEERRLGRALFVIVGDGEGRDRLVRYASLKDCNNMFFIPGMNRSMIQQVASESDLGLQPLLTKVGLFKSILFATKSAEFLASGTPILAPRGTLLGAIVTRYQAGYEVDFSDPMSIYSVLEKALGDTEVRLQLSRHARQLAVDLFSLDRAKETIKVMMRS